MEQTVKIVHTFPTNVAKQEIMIMLVLLVLLVYPAADSEPETAIISLLVSDLR